VPVILQHQLVLRRVCRPPSTCSHTRPTRNSAVTRSDQLILRTPEFATRTVPWHFTVTRRTKNPSCLYLHTWDPYDLHALVSSYPQGPSYVSHLAVCACHVPSFDKTWVPYGTKSLKCLARTGNDRLPRQLVAGVPPRVLPFAAMARCSTHPAIWTAEHHF
jgi:hypothetical protein